MWRVVFIEIKKGKFKFRMLHFFVIMLIEVMKTRSILVSKTHKVTKFGDAWVGIRIVIS